MQSSRGEITRWGAGHVGSEAQKKSGAQYVAERYRISDYRERGCFCLSHESRESRRRRRELLGPRLLRQPGGGPATTGVVAGEHLLSYERVRRRRRFPRA